jgi:hyperosmotically inducible periplasmic protein
MNRKTILALLAGAALSFAAACDGNDNANTNTNANRAANANAVATATPAPTVANTNTVNWNWNREDFNKNANDYRARAKNQGESIGESIEDGWIHFKVRAALAAVDDLRDSTINVDVDKNVVTLRGTVPGADHKKKAEDAAKKVEGVKSVTNKLEVKADANSNKTVAPNANSNKK